MSIRVIKKEPELPPAHLYLEDIEEIVKVMKETAKKGQDVKDDDIEVYFVVGKRECDSIEDLKNIGGTWREFEAHVGGNAFRTHITASFVNAPTKVFDHVLKVMTARETAFRSFLYKIPWWTLIILFWIWEFTPSKFISKVGYPVMLTILAVPFLLTVWAISAHTIVELRYSHEKSPRRKLAQESASKAIWIILGALLASVAQWLWHRFIGR